MFYTKEFQTKNGQIGLIRHAGESDAQEVLRTFRQTHQETDFLTSLPEENTGSTVEGEAAFLKETEHNPREVELIAIVNGRVAGNVGLTCVRDRIKMRHRAEIGISVEKEFWDLGIGRALMEACIDCARQAEYLQVELEVVGDNSRAIALYEKLGFEEFGRNPMGFRMKDGRFQTLVHMRKVL